MNREKSTRFRAKIVNVEISVHPYAWHPPMDVFETEEEYVIRIEIAGMHEEDFTVSLDGSKISVTGKRLLKNRKCAYHRMEILYGEFRTGVELPGEINSSEASADYENGFLTIHAPKQKPKNVQITSQEGKK